MKINPKLIVLLCGGVTSALLIYQYLTNLVTTGNQSANGFGAVLLIIFLGLFNLALFLIFFVKRTLLIKSGMFIMVLPILCALLYSLIKGGSMFNENSDGGSFLWLLLITFPVGSLIILIGIIFNLVKRFNT